MKRYSRLLCLSALLAALNTNAWADKPTDASGSKGSTDAVVNSELNAELFYQLLLAEISANNGDISGAYGVLMEAARRSNSPRVYERAVELALRARSGESALNAAKSWSKAFPASAEANRYVLKILIGLNRTADTLEPLRKDIQSYAPKERASAISVIPRQYMNVTEKVLAAAVVKQALSADIGNAATASTAWATIGAMRLNAGNTTTALEAAKKSASGKLIGAEGAVLALNLMDVKAPAAETIVKRYLAGKPMPELRLAYVRKLLESNRLADAQAQLKVLTVEKPDFADAWLIQGSVEYQAKQIPAAKASLERFLALTESANASGSEEQGRSQVQAYLVLSQIAEQEKDLALADAYLLKVTNPQDMLRVQSRRALLLARQGKLDEARALIRSQPELQPEDARAKVSAEVQLLREVNQNAAVYELLADAVKRFPDDFDLVYDQAMAADKLGKFAEMEQLLRQVMAAKPDDKNAYNALGYSLADRNVRLPEARALIVKALELAPNDPFIVDSLAWVEYRSGNLAEAARLLKQAFGDRQDAEIAAHLGEVLWLQGQRDNAIAIWNTGTTLNADNETLQETTKRLRGKP